MRDYFETIAIDDARFAAFYDDASSWSAPFGQLLLAHVPLRAGIAIVDVGAGTGLLTIELVQRCRPGATVVAVDPWTNGLAHLEQKAAYLGVGADVVCVGQAIEAADLPDASADLVVANLVVNNLGDPAAALAACRRVTRAGGTIALTTNLEGHMHEFYDVVAAAFDEVGLADLGAPLAEYLAHRGTVASVAQLLADAGFEPGRVVTDEFSMRFANGWSFLRYRLVQLAFVPPILDMVPPAYRDNVFDAIERRLDGEVAVTVPMAYIEGTVPA